MADFQDSKIKFPKPPPPLAPKPSGRRNPHQNPDPSSLWGAHDPAIFRDPRSGEYFCYTTGGIGRRSQDLIRWENFGKVTHPPQESIDWVGGDAIWAPDIIKVGSEYRLYCSSSKWGVQQSCIFLAVASQPKGPFLPRGIVLKSSAELPINAIDANPVIDQETNEHYMVYGSFWGGCYILRLDRETGLAAEGGIGQCIARRPAWTDCALEGPYLIFNPVTGYYYLFVSYGSLGSDYNIRVGRSRKITGPYYDHNGRSLTDLEDDTNEVGYLILGGYQFDQSIGFMAPGHNSVLCDQNNKWYLVCHIREFDLEKPQPSIMHIYKMFWQDDGWPVLNPQCYAGEETQTIDRKWLVGNYERIKFTPTIPQGVIKSVPMTLTEQDKFHCCSLRGEWELFNGTTLKISYGRIRETYEITPAWDWQRNQPTLAITGKDQFSIAVWGKRI